MGPDESNPPPKNWRTMQRREDGYDIVSERNMRTLIDGTDGRGTSARIEGYLAQVGDSWVVDENVKVRLASWGRVSLHDGFLVRRRASFVVEVNFNLATSAAEDACFLCGALLGHSGPRIPLSAPP